MILVIMAAGMGSRYGGLKQLDPVGPGGEFILDYSIYDAKRAGFNKVVFVIKKENLNLFRDTVGKRIEKVIKVEYVFQELTRIPKSAEADISDGKIIIPEDRKKPWGTAHAVYCCKDVIDDDFAVINSDDFYGREAFDLIFKQMQNSREKNRREIHQEYCMVGYRLKNTLTENGYVSRGVCCIDERNMLVSITEHTNIQRESDQSLWNRDGINDRLLEPEMIVSMNCWGFTKSLFQALDEGMYRFMTLHNAILDKAEYYLLDCIQEGIDNKATNVRVLDTGEKWFGVTYKEDREKVIECIRDLIKKNIYPDILWK